MSSADARHAQMYAAYSRRGNAIASRYAQLSTMQCVVPEMHVEVCVVPVVMPRSAPSPDRYVQVIRDAISKRNGQGDQRDASLRCVGNVQGVLGPACSVGRSC